MRKLTTEEFSRRAQEVHGDKYTHDQVVCVNINRDCTSIHVSN